jgi:hypothetical protein
VARNRIEMVRYGNGTHIGAAVYRQCIRYCCTVWSVRVPYVSVTVGSSAPRYIRYRTCIQSSSGLWLFMFVWNYLWHDKTLARILGTVYESGLYRTCGSYGRYRMVPGILICLTFPPDTFGTDISLDMTVASHIKAFRYETLFYVAAFVYVQCLWVSAGRCGGRGWCWPWLPWCWPPPAWPASAAPAASSTPAVPPS